MVNPDSTLRVSPSHEGKYHQHDRVQLLRRLGNSPLSMKDFAATCNVSAATLSRWVWRYLPTTAAQEIAARGHKARGRRRQGKVTADQSVSRMAELVEQMSKELAGIRKVLGRISRDAK